MRWHVPLVLAALVVPPAASSLGCQAAQRAAAKDPMRCERDPECQRKLGESQDCWAQCADDPACVDRCRQFQHGTDGLGTR